MRDIIWWTIDSIRRDHSSSFGYPRPTTPELDASTLEAIPARSHGKWTLPATASILTASEPDDHGMTNKGDFLPRTTPTVADRLRARGYHTIGLSANPWVAYRTGLSAGFDEFYSIMEDGPLLAEVGLRRAVQFLLGINEIGGGFELDTINHPSDWLMLALARQSLRASEGGNAPRFLYLHTKGAHAANDDYRPPPSWRGRVSPKGRTPEDRYDDLIGFVDSLWPWFDEVIRDDAIIVVTSDHGVPLGAGGMWYSKMEAEFEDQVKVPLWLRGIDLHDDTDEPLTHVELVNQLLKYVNSAADVAESETVADPDESMKRHLEALGYR